MSPVEPEWISLREFARRSKRDKVTVQRAIDRKELPLVNGKLDASLAHTAWCERNRKAGYPPVPDAVPAPSPAVPAPPADEAALAAEVDRVIAAEGIPEIDRPEADRRRAVWAAKKEQIACQLLAGTLLYASEVEADRVADYAQLRTKLLAIPAERAPAIHRLKTVAEVQDYLLEVVTEALEALARV